MIFQTSQINVKLDFEARDPKRKDGPRKSQSNSWTKILTPKEWELHKEYFK